MIEEINRLIAKKHELLVKLDESKNYETEAQREKDLILVGDLESSIREKTYIVMENKTKKIQKFDTIKINEMKDLRKILNDRYEEVRKLRDKSNELLIFFRKKLEEGRYLKEKLIGHNPTDQIPKELEKVKEEILKW